MNPQELPKNGSIGISEIKDPELPAEVSAHLQKSDNNQIVFDDSLKQSGATPAADDSSVTDLTQTSQSLPLTDDAIGQGMTAPANSNLRWLVEWCWRQLLKAHVHLKKISGHFIRVANATKSL